MKSSSNRRGQVRWFPRRAISVMPVFALGALALGACDGETSNADDDGIAGAAATATPSSTAAPSSEPEPDSELYNLACLGVDEETCGELRCHPVRGSALPDMESDQYMFCWPPSCLWTLALTCMRSADGSQCLRVGNGYSPCADDWDLRGWEQATCGEGNCPPPF